MDLVLLFQADSDIQSAFDRYEKIQTGRGEIFLRQLDLTLGMLRRHPHIGSAYSGHYRRILMPDFPYGVFYSIQGSRIVVAAVMNLRQNPQSIKKRLIGEQPGPPEPD